MKQTLFQGPAVALPQMLAARERRARLQQQLLTRHGVTLVCLTLNLAGPRKRFALADELFEAGRQSIEAAFVAGGWPALETTVQRTDAGCEAFWSVDGPAQGVKRSMTAIEQGDPAARLFDIDVLRPTGEKLQRQEDGHGPRLCFLCGRPAAECGRSRTHSVDELQAYTDRLVSDWVIRRRSGLLADTAVQALLYEVSVTPKPGLVDRENNGAHRDMNFYHFVDSACALRPYFTRCAALGMTHWDSPAQTLFPLLKTAGAEAEARMLRVTGGVNTHKGAIFSMGLLCGGAGILTARGEALTPAALCETASLLAAAGLDAHAWQTQAPVTGGELAYARHGMTGVRGEAAAGFPAVREVSLPTLLALLAEGYDLNRAAAVTLLHLMARTEDTNVVKRRGREALEALHAQLQALLAAGVPSLEEIQALDRQLTGENISPGGCADLLAVTVFLWLLGRDG